MQIPVRRSEDFDRFSVHDDQTVPSSKPLVMRYYMRGARGIEDRKAQNMVDFFGRGVSIGRKVSGVSNAMQAAM